MMKAELIRERLVNDIKFAHLREEVLKTIERYMLEGMPKLTYSLFRLFENSGEREQYQRVYFGRRGILSALALTSLASDNPVHCEALQDVIWDICNEYTWCLPAHLPAGSSVSSPLTVDLFAAETAHTLAEIVILLQDKLSSDIQLRVRMEVERRVFEPVFSSDKLLHWETAEHNWAAVCGGTIGMAALLLVKDDDRLAKMIQRMKAAMNCFLSGYGEDGGCAEGIGYWEYGFGYFVYFADMLSEYSRGLDDLLDLDKIRAIAAFPEAVHLSGGVFANYSDSPERMAIQTGLLGYLGKRFGECTSVMSQSVPGLHDDPCYRWAHLIRNIAWSETRMPAESAPFSTGLTQLNTLGWYIDRRGADSYTSAFSTKAGHNGEPHNHNDLGHFIIHGGGTNLLCDLGSGFYTRDYFGEGRYSILNNSSAGHSVPVLNGFYQAAGKQFCAKVIGVQETERGSTIELDLTHAYPLEAELGGFIRRFIWECGEGPDAFVLNIEDRIDFVNTNATEVEERFISRICPEITQGTIIWADSRVHLSLHYDPVRFQTKMEIIQQQDHAGKRDIVFMTKLSRNNNDKESIELFRFDLQSM
ncbi:heparinase II/III family protein [Paenibacillus sp. V4I7]|uniref:heparinase II/III domain-containing protein n=1 Tax=Paenibacillus sp. V4I7 TaxID=3042307 RepID=UPI002788A322|nr:heparinase II/III family protein [Paenibacillus sp. V4I7]MDQ0902083.1 hypothetical protein [Paenibacillus sp. V4I7]